MAQGSDGVALIVVDMLNPYDHEDADKLAESAESVVPVVAGLVERASAAGAEVIYVNDNFGNWNTAMQDLADRAMRGERPDLVEPLLPTPDFSFVTKLRHSIFYATPLEYLLRSEDVERVVLAGQVTEQCILYSALDAYVRHFEVTIPRDGVAAIHPDLAEAALRMIEVNMGGEIVDAEELFAG